MKGQNGIKDNLGRSFKTLRVSLLDLCNLSCLYCVSDERTEAKSCNDKKRINFSDFKNIIQKIHQLTPLETVRLTGGEPLLFKELSLLVKELKDCGIPKVKLTTNGFYLKSKISSLKEAGIDSINISLDAVEEKAFSLMSRGKNLNEIIEGVDAVVASGVPAKLNAVIMKGVNENQIIPLLNFAGDRGISIRFLELMKMGHLYHDHSNYFFSEKEILEVIEKKYSFNSIIRSEGATANYWVTKAGRMFGIISNISKPFCHDCTRLRLDSYGNIYGCLSNPFGISLLDSLHDDGELELKLKVALGQKKLAFTGSEMSMKAIGG